MVQTIETKETFIYFIISKKTKKIIYIGQTKDGRRRVGYHKFKNNNDLIIKIISNHKIKCLNNEYFRKYYEARWIYKFKPDGNKQQFKPASLNWFLIKMFLWKENAQAFWVCPLSNNKPFFSKFLSNTGGKKFYYNKYTRVWEKIDLKKPLYINGVLAFTYLWQENPRKSFGTKFSKVFKPREEKLTN